MIRTFRAARRAAFGLPDAPRRPLRVARAATLAVCAGVVAAVAAALIASWLDGTTRDLANVPLLAGVAFVMLAAGAALGLVNRQGLREQFRHAYEALRIEVEARSAAELALRSSEERHRSALNAVHDIIFQTDAAGRCTFLNKAWSDLTGWAVAESLGRPMLEFIHAEDRDACAAKFSEIFQSGGSDVRLTARLMTCAGGWRWVDVSAGRTTTGAGLGAAGTLVEVIDRRRAGDELERLALHDPLTGLANRALLCDHLGAALRRSARQGTGVAVLCLDLDRFKIVNDTLGHDLGDELLVAAAGRLASHLRPEDKPARLGGGEFVVLCEALPADPVAAATDAADISRRLQSAFALPFQIGSREVLVSIGVGIALARHGQSPRHLLAEADAAMYRAKDLGRARHVIFDAARRDQVDQRLQLESDLRLALERDELRLLFQPVVDLADGRLDGVEALIRWEHPERGLLAPLDFLDVAEDAGLMTPIGRWVLDEACRQAARWRTMAGNARPPRVSVNLSPRQLASCGVVDDVAGSLRRSGLPPELLCLEITEDHLIDFEDTAAAALDGLHNLGVLLAMDDFGTGYSSLSYLRRLPFDVVKMDRSFVSDIGQPSEDGSMLDATIGLLRSLSLVTVAEGVETADQLLHLRALGCDRAQGYLLSRPVASGEIDRHVAETASALIGG